MSILTFFLGVVLVLLGCLVLFKGLRGLAIVGRLLRRKTTALGALTEGPIEVIGTVTAIGEPLVSVSGHRCVAVRTTVNGQTGSSKRNQAIGSNTAQRVVTARLVDATGECLLELDPGELVGERWTSRTITEAELAFVPWLDLLPANATSATVEEVLIPEGATVLVSGNASSKAVEGGYRGTGTEWTVASQGAELLVISTEGQSLLVARTVVTAGLIFAIGIYLVALGVVTVGFSFAD